ncbi:MAG TPA: MauE/DoxX family redox-associated membrane protein [Candidatus Acidoferrales bacterium]
MASFLQTPGGRVVLLLGRLGLGGVLLYAGFIKLWSVGWGEAGLEVQRLPWITFAASVQAYELLPTDGVIFVAKWLPWLELALGAWLIAGIGLRWAGAMASALMGTFFVVMVRAFALGMDINCGCFGDDDPLSAATLVRDGALLALALALTVGGFLQTRGKREAATAVPAAGLPESTA